LNNHLKGKKKTKKRFSVPLTDIMASPFGVHPKVSTKINEATENKLNENVSFDLEPVSVTDSAKNDSYSETISPDDTSSIFGVSRKNNEIPESSSLNKSFVPKDESIDGEESPSVVVKNKPSNNSLLFASNADGSNNNTNIMTEMQSNNNNDLPYNLINDLENVNISENSKSKKTPFNKDISLVSPEKLKEMCDIPLDETIPEKSTRQLFTDKAKNIISGMFPLRDNKIDESVGTLKNSAINPPLENKSHETSNNLDKINKPDNSAILKPSFKNEVEQNVLFTGSANNDSQGFSINHFDIKGDERSSSNPLSINTSDTPKTEQLFTTPTKQKKISILYSSNIETASSLFSDDNKSDNNQPGGEFISFINQDNNNNKAEFAISQPQDNNIPLYGNQSEQNNTQINNNNIPFIINDSTDINDSSGFYNQNQKNSIPFLTSDNNSSIGYSSDIYNQSSPAKFYISSENATPINSNIYNNYDSPFAMSGTSSPIKNEINATISSNISSPLKTEVVNHNEKISSFNSQTTSPIHNETPSQIENIPFNLNSTSSVQSNNQNNEFPFFNIETSNIQNESFPTFTSSNQDNNIPLNMEDQIKNEQSSSNLFNNLENTNNQHPLSPQTENKNTTALFGNEVSSSNVFDTYSNQNNTNTNFFDSNNQGNNNSGNWFEQFSQSNDSLVISEILKFNF